MKKKSVIIIAEAGVNHNGSIKLAKRLIDSAKNAGADFVKFQTFKAEKLVTKNADKAQYQKDLTDSDQSQFQMIKKLELDLGAHKELINYCKQKNIEFLSTAFDHDSINLLNSLKIPFFKIPSGEITNLPYLRHIAQLGKPIIMSTGMSTLDEVGDALSVLIKSGMQKNKITIMHCNTEYPTPMIDVNLKAMLTIKNKFGVRVGYSDHTLGIEIPSAAVALGGEIIEKHLTLSRNMSGPDHAASLEPHEFEAMVKAIRNIERAMGNGIKCPSESEVKNIGIVRKSIIANLKIKKGETLTESNLTIKRPGSGISPMKWDQLIGSKSDKDYNKDDIIT